MSSGGESCLVVTSPSQDKMMIVGGRRDYGTVNIVEECDIV